jgi:formate dehydrogenase major subunit
VKVFWRLPTLFKSVQQQAVKDNVAKSFPLILTSGRLVEYEGGGEETRSNPWLAELQQENFVEINPKAAARPRHPRRRVRLGQHPGQEPGRRQRAHQGEGTGHRARRSRHLLHPVPLLRLVAGRGHAALLPEGAAPIVRGEAVNTATTYGYDRVTMMQESKTTLCQVAKV